VNHITKYERYPKKQSHESQQRTLENARRTLAILEQQAAGYTTLTIPAHLKIELEDKRREIAELENALRSATLSSDYLKPELLNQEYKITTVFSATLTLSFYTKK